MKYSYIFWETCVLNAWIISLVFSFSPDLPLANIDQFRTWKNFNIHFKFTILQRYGHFAQIHLKI